MNYLFNEPVEVDPDNLYNIVKILIGLEAEYKFLPETILRADRRKNNLFEVIYYEYVIGKVMIVPHTSIKSHVGVWIPSVIVSLIPKNSVDIRIIREATPIIMGRLAVGIRKELLPTDTGNIDHRLTQSDADPSNTTTQRDYAVEPLTDKEIKAMIAAAVEKVPDKSWDKAAVKMFLEGHSYQEIGDALCVTPERIGNRLSELRNDLGDNVVWRDNYRKKILILKNP